MTACRATEILKFQIVNLRKVGQGYGVQFSKWHHAITNVKIYKSLLYIYALALAVSEITNYKKKLYDHQKVNISEMVRVSEKCWSMTFMEVDICNRMRPKQIFYFVTFTKNFTVKLFKWLFWQGWKNASNYYWHRIGSQVFAIEWCHYECYPPKPWPASSRSNISNHNIF